MLLFWKTSQQWPIAGSVTLVSVSDYRQASVLVGRTAPQITGLINFSCQVCLRLPTKGVFVGQKSKSIDKCVHKSINTYILSLSRVVIFFLKVLMGHNFLFMLEITSHKFYLFIFWRECDLQMKVEPTYISPQIYLQPEPWVTENSQWDGLAAERPPLSNYMTAWRVGRAAAPGSLHGA